MDYLCRDVDAFLSSLRSLYNLGVGDLVLMQHVQRLLVTAELVLVNQTLMWIQGIPLTPLFRPPIHTHQVIGQLVYRDTKYIRQTIGLTLAHVVREERFLGLYELLEGGAVGDVTLDRRVLHTNFHLKREGVVGLVPLPPLQQHCVTVSSEFLESLLTQTCVLCSTSVQTLASTTVVF